MQPIGYVLCLACHVFQPNATEQFQVWQDESFRHRQRKLAIFATKQCLILVRLAGTIGVTDLPPFPKPDGRECDWLVLLPEHIRNGVGGSLYDHIYTDKRRRA